MNINKNYLKLLWCIIAVTLFVSLMCNYTLYRELNNSYTNFYELQDKYDNLKRKYINLYNIIKDTTYTTSNTLSKESGISTLKESTKNILFGFYLGMTKTEYDSLIKQYKQGGKLSVWTGDIYSMYWFKEANVMVNGKGVDNFYAQQEFYVIFDTEPIFQNNRLQKLSVLIEPLYDDSILINATNLTFVTNHISKLLNKQSSNHWSFQKFNITLNPTLKASKYYDNVYYTYYRMNIENIQIIN